MRTKAFITLTLPSLIFLLANYAFPLLYSLFISFHRWALYKPQEPMKFIGLQNYITLLGDPAFLNSLSITLIFTGVTVGASFGLGLLLAILVAPLTKPRKWIIAILILPMIVTPIVAGYIWRMLFSATQGIVNYVLYSLGVIGSMTELIWLGTPTLSLVSIIIVHIWQWAPYAFLILYAGIISLPREPFEAAQVDGASSFRIFINITLPLLKGVILVTLLLLTVFIFRVFDVIFILTGGGPGSATEVLSVKLFKEGFRVFEMGYTTAMSWIMLIITALIIYAYIRIIKF